MILYPFEILFPDVSRKETRSLHDLDFFTNNPTLRYAFFESYCVDPSCDCQRVLLRVRDPQGKILATISHSFVPDTTGFGQTFLDPLNPQSPEAPEILETFLNVVLKPPYEARLKRHYAMVKDALLDPSSHIHQILRENEELPALPPPPARRLGPKIGRNDPCFCGSGRKYKKCCGA